MVPFLIKQLQNNETIMKEAQMKNISDRQTHTSVALLTLLLGKGALAHYPHTK